MNSFISWVGGKKALRELIVSLFPLRYKKYVEVFGGGGWVLFHKPPGRDFEVYNDYNSLLVNLFRTVQSRWKCKKMQKLLTYSINSREEFNRIRKAMNTAERIPPVRRAAYYYQLIRYSYASSLTSFGGQPHDIRADFPLMDMATIRLKDVVLENKDFANLIRGLDSKDTFFYCDPPYHNSEGFYKNVGGFTEEDHIRLRDTLLPIKGKFLLSYNDDAFVRALYDKPGIYIMELSRLHNMKQRFEAGSEFPELLIANYNIFDPSELASAQTSLFYM